MKTYDALIADGCIICYNSPAENFSTFKSGGAVDTVVYPTNTENAGIAIDALSDNKYTVLGNGSNTLISDLGVEEPVLSLKKLDGYEVMPDGIYAQAGCGMMKLSRIARDNALSGLEFMYGIPGSVGGGVAMNAGAFGSSVSEALEYADVWKNGRAERLDAQGLGLSYRSSSLDGAIVLGAKFRLKGGNPLIISSKMRSYHDHRRTLQPDAPSLGSVFKRVGDTGAGYYIEQAGLKGASVGGAKVSLKHANFIVNTGGASSADFMELAAHVADMVESVFGVKLEREVKYIGRGIEDIRR